MSLELRLARDSLTISHTIRRNVALLLGCVKNG